MANIILLVDTDYVKQNSFLIESKIMLAIGLISFSLGGRRYTRKRVGGNRRRNIKRWAGEKPSMIDKIARYAGPVGKIARTVAGIVQMVNTEKKYVDNDYSNTSVGSTGNLIATYTTMAQGLGDQARMGNTIKGKSISGKIIATKSTIPTTTQLRLLWVLDKECDGAAPVLSDVLDSVNTLAGVNRNFSKRFVILKDKLVTLSSGGNDIRSMKFFFPTDFHIHFDGSTSAITDAKENHVFLYAISDSIGGSSYPIVSHWGRFNYYDN